ncbi:MAG: efflux RND transporter permease subunit, partial [Alphaproteobacteria bacterium]
MTDLFIRRPVLATVVSLLILLLGAQAGWKLAIRQFPELQSTEIVITTTYPGASADLMQGFVTTPLQQAVASADGIDFIVSSSTFSTSQITLSLRLNANGDRALTEVLAKINQVRNVLPREANDPVVVKQAGQTTALMYIGFNSDVMTAPQITDYLNRVVKPYLQTIPGVANADILGGQSFAMRVWLDPRRMAALSVTPADVVQALRANNFVSAPGQIKGDFIQLTINAETSPASAEAFSRIVVAVRDGTLIRLGNVAQVELGPEQVNSSSAFDGLRAVFIGIFAQPSANPLTTIADVRTAMDGIKNQLPTGLSASIAYDATVFIEASIKEVAITLAEAAVIVIIVIFLFLGNLRSTFIPIVTIPLSLIGVLFLLYALGYSINLLTLLALVLAIGLVVDDAIVVVENIHRHIEEGMTPVAAAFRGAREIALPVVAMTLTLAAVYAPIGFVGGLTGALFREFAFTLASAVIVSGIIALTLSPMMCSKLLVPAQETRGFAAWLDRRYEGLQRAYRRRLESAMTARPVMVFAALVIVSSCVFLYVTARKELAPAEDQGAVFMVTKAPQHTNLDYLDIFARQIEAIARTFPEKSNTFIINGQPTVHGGFAGMLLKPWGERTRDQAAILAEFQQKASAIAGVQVFAFPLPSLPGISGGPPVQFVVTSPGDYQTLAEVISNLTAAAWQSGLFIFVDSDLRFDNPQTNVAIDQAKANELGITMEAIGAGLATMFGGNFVNRFNLYGRSYQVIPQAPRDYRLSPDSIKDVRVRTGQGTLVPLSTVVTVTTDTQPNALTTFQQLNSATLQAVMFPGRALGEGITFLEQKAAEMFPEGYSYDFKGESRQFAREGNTLAIAFGFAVIVIFLVLAAQFESFRDPLIIMIAVPMSICGALIPLNIGISTVNIYTQIGLVTLIGLITKHGILIVNFANQLQETRGLDRMEAVVEAASIRLRPILMTTAAMVVAMVPLLIATGAGARSRFDIGLVIAAGMTVGTMFTLFVV